MYLAKMPELTKLEARATQVTDQGIQQLSALPKLYRVYLHETQVTKDGADQLKANLSAKNPKVYR